MNQTMLQEKQREFPKAIWVQIYRNHMQILNSQGHPQHTIVATEKYDHPRSILNQFHIAETALSQLLSMQKQPWYDKNPLLLLQVSEPYEGGLTFVEQRALLELGYNAGARQIWLFDDKGTWLNTDQPTKKPSAFDSTLSKVIFIVVLIFFILIAKFLNS